MLTHLWSNQFQIVNCQTEFSDFLFAQFSQRRNCKLDNAVRDTGTCNVECGMQLDNSLEHVLEAHHYCSLYTKYKTIRKFKNDSNERVEPSLKDCLLIFVFNNMHSIRFKISLFLSKKNCVSLNARSKHVAAWQRSNRVTIILYYISDLLNEVKILCFFFFFIFKAKVFSNHTLILIKMTVFSSMLHANDGWRKRRRRRS